jgi:hypothetical protein
MSPEWTIVLTVIAGGIGAYLGTYIRQKGQNLATKEDIAEITRIQESIKAELANRSHFSRVRYERETEIYRDLWQKCFAYYEAVTLLPATGNWNPESPAGNACVVTRNDLIVAIRNNRPFYPREIWEELITFQNSCLELKFIKESPYQGGRELLDLPKKMKSELEKLEIVIRARLDKFDAP